MSRNSFARRILPVAVFGLALSLATMDAAEARRGGGFGSRGARTFQVPRSTQTAPTQARPIERSMTPQGQQPRQATTANSSAAAAQQRPSFLRRWGGPLLGGLALGGLVGMLMGHGFGGAAGMMGMLLQLGILALGAMLVMRLFRGRQQPQAVDAPMAMRTAGPQPFPSQYIPPLQAAVPSSAGAGQRPGDEIGIGDRDFDAFEKRLQELQQAFAAEDFAALREVCTPEIVSYLSEELGQNAVCGRRNEVSQTTLVSGDLAEAWREDDTDYATVAMRYSSIDVMRDRQSGKVVEGDPEHPTETTEVWTFSRQGGPWGGQWKVSAIQDA
jgi:predicted lipid-binding transport protein (Tim44 family)